MEYEDNTRVPFFLGLLYESFLFSAFLRCKASQYSSKLYVQVSRFWRSLKKEGPTRERGRGPNRPKGRANGEPTTKLENFSEKAAAEVCC